MSGSNIITSLKKSTELKCIKRGKFSFNKNILLFCTLRNDSVRIPFFLNYYRNLGVEHFFFVDNNSDDGFLDLIRKEHDVTVYHTDGSYKNSNFGMDWLNYLLRKFGCGKWCITCDTDEFLVYPDCEVSPLDDFVKILDSKQIQSFYTLLLDMYPKGQASNYQSGENPLISSGYFDGKGDSYLTEGFKVLYNSQPCSYSGGIWVQGGPRYRVFYKDDHTKSPALNKFCLVKWSKEYYYMHSMHSLFPKRLNESHNLHLTGAMLHFKFLSTFKQKVDEELKRKQHYGDSCEYKKYSKKMRQLNFYDQRFSVKYEDSDQLCKLGLIRNKI